MMKTIRQVMVVEGVKFNRDGFAKILSIKEAFVTSSVGMVDINQNNTKNVMMAMIVLETDVIGV